MKANLQYIGPARKATQARDFERYADSAEMWGQSGHYAISKFSINNLLLLQLT